MSSNSIHTKFILTETTNLSYLDNYSSLPKFKCALVQGSSSIEPKQCLLIFYLLALVKQIIRPLLATLSAVSIKAVRFSCCSSVILHSASTAATRPCKMLQHSGSSRGFGGPTAARADISWKSKEEIHFYVFLLLLKMWQCSKYPIQVERLTSWVLWSSRLHVFNMWNSESLTM